MMMLVLLILVMVVMMPAAAIAFIFICLLYTSMCVHDIDLIRWFTGSDVKNVWAIGGVFEFDLYKELNDADNAARCV